MKKKWSVTKLTGIASVAALTTILSLPGALLAGLTGITFLAVAVNSILIGIIYSLVVLLFKQFGAVTLWAFISGVLVLPLPIAGPPGFLPKIFYFVCWGILTDLLYLILRRREKLMSIIIGSVQLGPAIILAVWFWTLLGAPDLAKQYSQSSGLFFIIAGSTAGGFLGFVGYLIYKKLENTALVKRIQGNSV